MTNHGSPFDQQAETLLLLSDPWLSPDRAEFLRHRLRELRGELDWGWLIDQAARHKVLPLVGYNVNRFRLFKHPEEEFDTIPYRWVLTAAYEANRRRNEALRDEFAVILKAAESLKIPYALRKGPLLGERLYPEAGLRRMQDIDLLMTRADAAALGSALSSFGYSQGKLSADGTKVEEFSRGTRRFWSLNVNNALPYMKPSTDPYVEWVEVDFCHDLTPSAGPGGEERTMAFLARSVPVVVCGVPARRLSVEDEIVDLCVHLHKEADARHYIALGTDLMLSKFMDVACAASRCTPDQARNVAERVAELGCQDSVFYALHYTQELYPGTVPGELLDAVRPADRSVLVEYGHLEGKPAPWTSTFSERLFSTRRVAEASDARHLPVK
ncbi:nucleotidyltransferase family protein [Streptomyces sp. NPDC017520]|uniref:nucleotidyltransferase family protein n=1 Tax=Streptomyces sp. NPDC017520 TaxID=3364998 RepID=UPI003792F508